MRTFMALVWAAIALATLAVGVAWSVKQYRECTKAGIFSDEYCFREAL